MLVILVIKSVFRFVPNFCGLWIATNCFNGFNRRNGNLKFVE